MTMKPNPVLWYRAPANEPPAVVRVDGDLLEENHGGEWHPARPYLTAEKLNDVHRAFTTTDDEAALQAAIDGGVWTRISEEEAEAEIAAMRDARLALVNDALDTAEELPSNDGSPSSVMGLTWEGSVMYEGIETGDHREVITPEALTSMVDKATARLDAGRQIPVKDGWGERVGRVTSVRQDDGSLVITGELDEGAYLYKPGEFLRLDGGTLDIGIEGVGRWTMPASEFRGLDALIADVTNLDWNGDLDLLCRVMHDAYEAKAAEVGWSSNPESRVEWAEVPESNKAAMRAGVRALLAHLDENGQLIADTDRSCLWCGANIAWLHGGWTHVESLLMFCDGPDGHMAAPIEEDGPR